jgi:hypothetical protein
VPDENGVIVTPTPHALPGAFTVHPLIVEHGTHVPPLQRPTLHAVPSGSAAPGTQTGPPLEHEIDPVEHPPGGEQLAPGEHGTQVPLPLHTPPGHDVPAPTLPDVVHTGPPLAHEIAPVVHGLPVLHDAPGEHATHAPLPLHTPPGHDVPAPTLPVVPHTGPPVEHPIDPVVHGFPVLHDAPGEHATHVPLPLHTPPGHDAPAPTLPDVVHTGPPLEHEIDPVVHGLPVLHDAPGEHATHVPLPLHTPPGHDVPAARLPEVPHTGPPVEQPIDPVVHGLPVLHEAPFTHGTHAPLPLHTPPGHDVPAARLPDVVHTGPPLEQSIVPVVHGLPVLHDAPLVHATHVPDPLHTPPAQLAPGPTLPVVVHTGAPLEQSSAPVVHGLPVPHDMPLVHATQLPVPLHTPPAHVAPAPTLPVRMHTGAPVEVPGRARRAHLARDAGSARRAHHARAAARARRGVAGVGAHRRSGRADERRGAAGSGRHAARALLAVEARPGSVADARGAARGARRRGAGVGADRRSGRARDLSGAALARRARIAGARARDALAEPVADVGAAAARARRERRAVGAAVRRGAHAIADARPVLERAVGVRVAAERARRLAAAAGRVRPVVAVLARLHRPVAARARAAGGAREARSAARAGRERRARIARRCVAARVAGGVVAEDAVGVSARRAGLGASDRRDGEEEGACDQCALEAHGNAPSLRGVRAHSVGGVSDGTRGSTMWNSTRRFAARPSSVSLLSTGRSEPWPSAARTPSGTPCSTSQRTTLSARRCESRRLWPSPPRSSVWPSTRTCSKPLARSASATAKRTG